MSGYKEWKDLEIFKAVEKLSEILWSEVSEWDKFAKYSVGIQLIKSVDSFAANIEEADGRYHFKEKLNFLYIARGSLKETRRWLIKAQSRGLFKKHDAEKYLKEIEDILPRFNAFISDQRKRFHKKS